MKKTQLPFLAIAAAVAAAAGALYIEAGAQQPAVPAASASRLPVTNVYAQTGADMLSPAVKGHLERVYVPNLRSNEVYVIEPATAKVVDKIKVGRSPQHVVPPCGGGNHADFSADNKYAIFTCEFNGTVAKVDLDNRKVLGYLKLQMPQTRFREGSSAANPLTEICTAEKGMPQDIRISPDGKRFFIADMHADGVHVVDGDAIKQVGIIPTGLGAHGLYPSRDGTKLYVANRSTHKIHGKGMGPGSVSVIDFATSKVVQTWR